MLHKPHRVFCSHILCLILRGLDWVSIQAIRFLQQLLVIVYRWPCLLWSQVLIWHHSERSHVVETLLSPHLLQYPSWKWGSYIPLNCQKKPVLYSIKTTKINHYLNYNHYENLKAKTCILSLVSLILSYCVDVSGPFPHKLGHNICLWVGGTCAAVCVTPVIGCEGDSHQFVFFTFSVLSSMQLKIINVCTQKFACWDQTKSPLKRVHYLTLKSQDLH